MFSKNKIDKAGKILASGQYSDEEYIEADDIFNEYREAHLQPLIDVTSKIQSWMEELSIIYCMAYRLKRKPQILKKLLRFTTRLSQLQDIGGCRIIVDNNKATDMVIALVKKKVQRSKFFLIKHITDYRDRGRDITGYRAVHIIIERDRKTLEIQIRTRMQHYWAESVERASIIYRKNLKETEGDKEVISYFKLSSDVFYNLEHSYSISPEKRIALEMARKKAEKIIRENDEFEILHSSIEKNFIDAMESAEYKANRKIQNWLLIFNWKTGNFQNWQRVDVKDPRKVACIYAKYERDYSVDNGYEVVMVGSTDVSTIRHTHSHYFGIEKYDNILDSLEDSMLQVKKEKNKDNVSIMLLFRLMTHGRWGKKTVSINTIKNHYNVGASGEVLLSKIYDLEKESLIIFDRRKECISLNYAKKGEILKIVW